MHATVVEAVPAATLRALAVALEVPGAVVAEDVVLTRNEEDPLLGLEAAEDLVRRVEFVGL